MNHHHSEPSFRRIIRSFPHELVERLQEAGTRVKRLPVVLVELVVLINSEPDAPRPSVTPDVEEVRVR